MSRAHVSVPRENADAIARRFGPSGRTFLRELPVRLTRIAARLDLTLGEPLPVGVGGYLVRARTSGGDAAVLKLSPTGDPAQDRATVLEDYALRRWDGDGAARVLFADPAAGALLLEQCEPGHRLDVLADEPMVAAGCLLARRLHRQPDAEDVRALPDAVERAAAGLPALGRAMRTLGHPLSAGIERLVVRSHEAVCASGAPTVVCHGDTNPGNLLAARRMDWLAVDPLPIRAPSAYDAASLVWSRRSWLLARPDPVTAIERRIALAAETLGAERGDVRAWTLVRLVELLVDRASWGGYDETPFLAVAELLGAAGPRA